MATETLNQGAKTMAASGWSGSGIADSNDYRIEHDFGPLEAGLDHSGLTVGIESMWFTPGSEGIVGGGSFGALKLDADATADAFVRNHGKVKLYIEAAGASAKINYFDAGPFSDNNLQGGTFGTVYAQGGNTNVNGSTVIENAKLMAGNGTFEYNASGAAITVLEVTGGTWHIKRAPTAMIISGDAVVIYEPDDLASHTGTTVTINGGLLDWRKGAIETVNANGGMIDFRSASGVFAPGATAFPLLGTTIIENPLVDLSNAVVPDGLIRNIGNLAISGKGSI